MNKVIARKQQNALDRKLFKNMEYIEVVTGYHYGFKKRKSVSRRRPGKIVNKPYIDTVKKYSFKVTAKTHHLQNAKKGRIASVNTKYGKRFLVITGFTYAKGAKAKAMVKPLKPVINFEDRRLTGQLGYLYKTYVQNGNQ